MPAQRPGHVGGAVEGDALGRFAVAPGAADLLPVGLDGARRIGVDDEADVGLSTPMPKAMVATITAASASARNSVQPRSRARAVEAGVIGDGGHARVAQGLGQLLASRRASRQ